MAFRLARTIHFRNVASSGLDNEADHPGREDTASRTAMGRTHLFYRNERFSDSPPRFIRWMWDPRTGDALLGTAGRHADILRRYTQTLKEKTRRPAPFPLWLRGFWFPVTNELVMRPFNVAAIGREGDRAFSDRMQRHVKRLIEKQLERKIPRGRFLMNADNAWLTDRYGGRW